MIGNQTANKLQNPNNKHIKLERFAELADRVLCGIVETIVADLGEAQHDEGHQVYAFCECVRYFLWLLDGIYGGFVDGAERGFAVETGNVVEGLQALAVSFLDVVELGGLANQESHEEKDHQRDNENIQAYATPVMHPFDDRI